MVSSHVFLSITISSCCLHCRHLTIWTLNQESFYSFLFSHPRPNFWRSTLSHGSRRRLATRESAKICLSHKNFSWTQVSKTLVATMQVHGIWQRRRGLGCFEMLGMIFRVVDDMSRAERSARWMSTMMSSNCREFWLLTVGLLYTLSNWLSLR